MKNFDLEKFKEYVNTYDKQIGHKNYSQQIIIDDFLYGIGLCINEEEYKQADGYKRFKGVILDHLQAKCYCGKPVDTSSQDCVDFSLCKEHEADS